ncbi:hypothetical protein QBC45DRAFT_49395 [Copromyces sp. CBS 386.78]|nr:hypothetical protein QBC45DRAFT_49395 [Copromyces sp. CBS 386.78]
MPVVHPHFINYGPRIEPRLFAPGQQSRSPLSSLSTSVVGPVFSLFHFCPGSGSRERRSTQPVPSRSGVTRPFSIWHPHLAASHLAPQSQVWNDPGPRPSHLTSYRLTSSRSSLLLSHFSFSSSVSPTLVCLSFPPHPRLIKQHLYEGNENDYNTAVPSLYAASDVVLQLARHFSNYSTTNLMGKRRRRANTPIITTRHSLER